MKLPNPKSPMILKFNNYEKRRRTPHLNLSPQAGRGGRLLTRPKSLHRNRENRYASFDPADFLGRQFLELERITCSIVHRSGNEQRSADGFRKALYARGNVHRVPNRSEFEPLRRTDAAYDGRAGMNSNSNLNWRALLCCQLIIQTFNCTQNFTPRRYSIACMVRSGVACTKDRHETVAQIFIDHPAMFLLNRAHAYPKKIIHGFHDFGRWRRARACRPGTHIDEHDGDFFFHSAQPGVACENAFRGAPAYV